MPKVKSLKSASQHKSKAEIITILKDFQNHNSNTSFILQKYKISDSSLLRWRKKYADEAFNSEPTPDVAIRKINALAIKEAVEITLNAQKIELVNTAANILRLRLEEKPEYIETRDLIAIIKLDLEDDKNPQQTEDFLTLKMKEWAERKKAAMRENAEEVNSE